MAYTEAKLLHNPKKGFADQYLARFWGIEIDGMEGILRGSSLRLWPTSVITMGVQLRIGHDWASWSAGWKLGSSIGCEAAAL